MKLADYLTKGAQDRIKADLQRAAPGDQPLAYVTALAGELALKMQAEVSDLKARIAELERNPADQYKGVFRRDLEYRRGDTTTHKGSMWLALADNNDTPGASSAWRLVSKGDKPA